MSTPVSTAADPQVLLQSQAAQIARLQVELRLAELKIQSLKIELAQERIARFGPRTENITNLQLLLLEQEPSVTRDEVSAENGREPLAESDLAATTVAAPQRRPHRKPHPGRQELPAHLPRVEEILACPPEACRCPHCQQETVVIGYDESEVLDVEPAKYIVRVTKREKRACRQCSQRSVVAAALPARIIGKSQIGRAHV